MEKKYILWLIIIAFFLCNCVAYFDEGIRTFDYLKSSGDWGALIMYTVLFLGLPLAIFLFSKEKERNRFYYSLFEFLPVLLLIFIMI